MLRINNPSFVKQTHSGNATFRRPHGVSFIRQVILLVNWPLPHTRVYRASHFDHVSCSLFTRVIDIAYLQWLKAIMLYHNDICIHLLRPNTQPKYLENMLVFFKLLQKN